MYKESYCYRVDTYFKEFLFLATKIIQSRFRPEKKSPEVNIIGESVTGTHTQSRTSIF